MVMDIDVELTPVQILQESVKVNFIAIPDEDKIISLIDEYVRSLK
jgi:hypothetical protein